ncbi:MAG TPA: BON domain-containing protein [Usitatibacter sp.]|jgi:osmotically-inducible protein OsmY|nr:BON domain-containing protein [Usitatibacter sp.]
MALLLVAYCGTASAAEAIQVNPFDDPFLEVTRGMPSCPQPKPPAMTAAEARGEAHVRVERGTRCYMDGHCRLPNAYRYDAEIIPRVKKAILADGRFGDTAVWALGQRRWVFLQGCVRSRAQSQALEKLVRGLDDVERVVNQLSVSR